MAMTPSQLSIIVKSDGIVSATTNLDKLQQSAKNAEGAVTSLSTAARGIGSGMNTRGMVSQLASLGAGVQSLISTFNSLTNASSASVANLTNSLAAAISRIQALEASVRQANAELARLNGGLGDADRGFRSASRNGNIFNNTLRSMATAALAYVGINFAAGIIKEADAWSMMQSKLKLAVGSMELARSVQGDLYNMSQNLRVPLEDTAKLFTRMSVPLQKMGQTVGDTKKVVEAFSMALKLGGATGQEASSAMLQLSQSFNAGRLNGGEFNSVAEAAPSVLRAIEVELKRVGKGADLARYGLKELAAKGVLSTGIMAEALKRAAPAWAEEFKQLPLTVDGAMTRIKNAWQKAIGDMGQDTKFNEKMAKSLKTIEDMLPSVAKAIATALTFIVDNGEQVVKTFAAIAGLMTLAKLGAGISAMYAAGKAAMALSGGLAAVRAAMLAIGVTPLGLALTALGVVIGASITLLGRKKAAWEGAKEASDKVKNNADLIKSMQLETLAMMEQVDVARAKASLPSLYTKEIEEAKKAKQSTDALTTAKTTAAKIEQDILNWKKNQKGSIGTKIGEGEYYMPKELKDARDNAKKLVEQEEVKNKMIVTQTKLGAQQKEAVVKQEMDALAIKYALEAKTGKQRADAVKEAAIAELEVLKSQGLGKQAALDRMIIIEREYQSSLDKIKPTKAEKELSKEAEATKKLTQELEALTKEKALIIALGKDADKLLPAQKELIKMETEKASATDLNIQRQKVAQALEIKAVEDKFATQNKAEDLAEKSAKAAQEELQTVEDQITAFGKVKGSIQDSEIARLNEQLTIAKGIVGNEALVKSLEKEIETREKLKGKSGELSGLKDGAKEVEEAKKFLDDLYDTNKIDKFADASSKGLKGIIKGFAELSKVMDKSAVRQSSIAKERAAIDKTYTKDSVEWSAARTRADEREAEYKIAGWAETADAAKNFFQEGTRGYQAMDAVSKVMHAAQMVRSLQAAASGVMAGAAQMFGQSGWGGFAGVAAMGAVMAGLGYATGAFGSSGSGGMKAADVQKIQGSGTVFGDAEAKSESISKSIDMLKSSYDKIYPVNQKMLSSLQSIEASMTGLANLIVKQGGIAEGSNFGIKEGTISRTGNAATGAGIVAGTVGGMALGTNIGMGIGAIGGPIGMAIGAVVGALTGSLVKLWGKTTQSIVDSGLQFGGSLSDMQKGQGFNQYASVDTTKSSAFGFIKKTTNKVETQGLSDEISKQLGLVFTNMQTTLEEAGKTLYGSSTGVTTALNNMVMGISKLSLKGLTGDDVTKAINNVISKALDQMAATAFTNLDKFESVIGEGYAQKVIRIASTFATVNATMEKFNFKLFEMNDAGIQASLTFSKMFGTLQEMQGVTSSYFENFYREEDQLKIKTDAVTKIMKSLGQEMPATREGFKLLVDKAQALGNTELVANLMKVSGAFAEVVKWIEKTADASEKMDYNNTDPMFPDMSTLRDNAREVFNELSQTAQKWLSISKQASDVRASINTILWGNSATQDAAVKKSEKLWKMMSTDITVEQKLSLAGELKDAIISKYQLERESVTKLIDFSKQLRTYVDGLKLGSLSPLTMTQKLAEARKQYETTLSKAQAGDTTAQGALTGSASAYLEIAKTAYASSDAYQAIFMNITSTLESMTLDTKTADEKLLEVNQRQEAELIKLIYALDTIESVADSYYKTSLQGMTNQLTALNLIYTRMGVFDGVATELSGLPAEIAAALSGTFGRSSGKDYVEALYGKFAGKTGSQIDQGGMQYWMRELELYGRDYVLKAFQDSVAKTTQGIDVPNSPFAPAPMMPPSQATVLTEQVATLKEEIIKLREDAQMQTIALMETLTLTSKQNADRIVEGTTEGMDKNNPNWNKATLT